ncbi:hypothetical protein V7T18_09775 [Segatella copri]|uniref:hypothetical protein n=1 Tax=Segatella copri TaxID=165179 RepID=UPI002FEFBB92
MKISLKKDGNPKEYTITNGTNGTNYIWTIGDDGYWYLNDKKTEYKAKGDKGENGTNGTNGMYYVPNPATGCFDIYQDGNKVKSTQIAYTSTKENIITATWEKDVLTLLGVKDAKDGKVTISLTTDLKALVFSPDFYYEGIEAFDFATYEYQPKKVEKVDANGDYKNDAPTNVGSLFTYAPDLSVDYFLNPANAKMDADASKYSFIVADKKYTRAEAIHNITVKSADLESHKGMVTVKAKYDGDAIKKIASDKQVTVAALQYAGENGTVTSDFAAITTSKYTNLVLNNPKAATKGHAVGASHLYRTAKAAIDGDASITIAWNNPGIDLREYVNTDRIYREGDNVGSCVAWDENAAAGTVEKDGFKYSFELVGYKSGDNKTSQSAHAAIKQDGYTLRPQMTKGGEQQEFGYDQNAAEIGRQPLVRVTLTDAVNKKIVAVGYIKIEIAATDKKDDQKVVPVETVNTNYTVACGENNILVKELKWHEVEEQVMALVNMGKAEFESTYVLDGATVNAGDVNQFEKPTLDAVALSNDKKVGIVSQTTTDILGTQTEVLDWNVKNNYAYEQFKTNKKDELTTYVRFTLREGKSAANKYIYVQFTWKPEKKNLDPTTSFSDDEKLKSYWYGLNGAKSVKETGAVPTDIHGNVEVVGTNDNSKNGATTDAADDEYVFNITNTLNGNKLVVSKLTGDYAGLNDELKATFHFVDGNNFYAQENTTTSKLYADKACTAANEIASMDIAKGIVTLSNTEMAKSLLNKVGHKDLKNTLTAVVAVKATICGNIDVPVSNNTFNVKFLRPVNIISATTDPFKDGVTGGETKDIKMVFTDWRDHNFTETSVTKGHDYFKYYGIKEIKVVTADATTDLNGNWNDKLNTLTQNIKFTWTPANGNAAGQIEANDYGKLTYVNNGNTVGTFHVHIPVFVTYDWGTLKAEIEVTIEGTVNNAKRH